MLTVHGVHTFYGAIEALKGVDLSVAPGEIVTLIGANGAGKTTLLMTICGNPRARQGRIQLGDEDIRDHPQRDRPIARRPAHLCPHDGDGEPANGRPNQ